MVFVQQVVAILFVDLKVADENLSQMVNMCHTYLKLCICCLLDMAKNIRKSARDDSAVGVAFGTSRDCKSLA